MRQPNKRLGVNWNKQKKPVKRRVGITKKKWFECVGGMFDGQKILLTDGYTMIFSASGMKGRYVPDLINKERVRFEQC